MTSTGTLQEIITIDNAISLGGAAKLCAIDGKAPALSTVYRWCLNGVDGIRLSYKKLGKRMVTSRPAVDRFMRDLAEADERRIQSKERPAAPVTRRVTDRSRRTSRETAESELAAAGL